ncbi:hypothetical protein Q8F55_008093 [Vanrija albida]|uniref:Uncharacterized protein n=1 Tax=Vanrija albida TaxID=181172 RepID=A0ABR3PVA4_9TREE
MFALYTAFMATVRPATHAPALPDELVATTNTPSPSPSPPPSPDPRRTVSFQLPGEGAPERSTRKRRLEDEPDGTPKPKREPHFANERRFKASPKAMFDEAKGYSARIMAQRLGSRGRWGSHHGHDASKQAGHDAINDMEFQWGKIESVLWDVELECKEEGREEGLAPAVEGGEGTRADRSARLDEVHEAFDAYTASIEKFKTTHKARVNRLRADNRWASPALEVPQHLLPHNLVANWTASMFPDLLVVTPRPAEEADSDSEGQWVPTPPTPTRPMSSPPSRPTTPPPSQMPQEPTTPPSAPGEFHTVGLNASPGQRSVHFRRAEVDGRAAHLRGLIGALTDTERFWHLDREERRRGQRRGLLVAKEGKKPQHSREPTSLSPPEVGGRADSNGGTGAWSFLKTLGESRSSNAPGAPSRRIRSDGVPRVINEEDETEGESTTNSLLTPQDGGVSDEDVEDEAEVHEEVSGGDLGEEGEPDVERA